MITHKEKLAQLSPERRKKIEKGTQALLNEYEAIQTLRTEFGLTQSELADRIGVGQPMISKLENGEIKLSLDNLSKIINALSPKAEWEITVRIPEREAFTIQGSSQN